MAHKEVVIDVNPLAFHHGFHQHGAPDDLLVADGLLVHVTHDNVPLVIDLPGYGPELLFQGIDPCVIGVDLRGVLI